MFKLSITAVSLSLGLALAPAWAQPAPLTTLRQVHELTNAQASKALPVSFTATVTFSRWFEQSMFVQDQGVGIYLQTPPELRFSPGDRVLVKGKTHNSFRPEIVASSVQLLGHGPMPQPVSATFDQMSHGQLDSTLVRVRGTVRNADLTVNTASGQHSIVLGLVLDGGPVRVELNSSDERAVAPLLDADVEVTGVAAGIFDGKNQLTALDLYASTPADIRVLRPAQVDPWSVAPTPMDEILAKYHVDNHSQRVLVHGIITYHKPGSMVVLQEGGRSLRVLTKTFAPLRVGDEADATGFPSLMDGFLTLSGAEVKDLYRQALIQPVPATWAQLASSANLFDLVSIEGTVVMEQREAVQDEYLLVSNGHPFSAIYRHPDPASSLPVPAMKDIPLGSAVRVTGICIPYSSDPFSGPVPFDMLLRSGDDLAVISNPPWLTVTHLMMLSGVLLLLVFGISIRAWLVERGSRRQIASMAYIEKRRRRILEDINNSRPLAEILERITELVSARLHGAACWCQVMDGACLGNRPRRLPDPNLRVVEHTIPGRSGNRLGTLYTVFHARTAPQPAEQEALAMAAGVATLAIETSRLYSDLVHRSEFDQLTDVPNRFSLEKLVDAQIEVARQSASIFGLLYIDMDDFKQVNDLYGHGVGDIYLQAAAARMKHQLRPGDTLARVGGDEFAVLLPGTHGRADVEEVATRLEHCFEQPFDLGPCVLRGTASIGVAVYPEDGASQDALMGTADAAMYESKRNRQERKAAAANL